MTDSLLTTKDVALVLCMSVEQFKMFRSRQGAGFPAPIRLGERILRWHREDISDWIESKRPTQPTSEVTQDEAE